MHELILFLEASLIAFLLTGALLRFSLRRSLLDVPNDRSSHTVPKPRLGGTAIIASFYLSFATLLAVGLRPFPSSGPTAGFLAAGAVIALVGLADDLRGLPAVLKLVVQIAAGGIVIYSGIVMTELKLPLIGTLELGPLAVPFTILWIIGFVNLYNFIDGIDGLAAGVGLIAAAFLLLVGETAGAPALGGCYAILAGSSFGFLRYNFPPARIFMGDMGSTFIGFTFAVLAVAGSAIGIPVFLTVLLLGGAIGDAVLTLFRRIIKRERIFSPHRTHYYQRLTSLGLSHKQVTLLEYLIAVLLGVSALFTFKGERIFVTFFSVTWLGFFLFVLAKVRRMELGGRLFWEGRAAAVALGDLAFVAASYVLSYYLRLNFAFPEAHRSVMLTSLPIVLVIRSAIFYYFGLYRSVWRYTTFDDVIRIAKAVSLSSIVMIVSFTLLFRFEAFPRSVFIIDWFILTVFITGSRIATRWFHELPSREEVSGRRTLIGGTGRMAELVLYELRQAGGVDPVGFVDDRTEMIGRTIEGLEVFGPFDRLNSIARDKKIEEIVLASSFAGRLRPEVSERLVGRGIAVRVVSDPAELSAGPAEGAQETRFAGRRVLVAGNGPLVGRAPAAFAGAADLAVLSSEAAALADTARFGLSGDGRITNYLGVMDDGPALERILERHGPESIVLDLTIGDGPLGNPSAAFVHAVLLPALKFAGAVSKRRGAGLVAIRRAWPALGAGEDAAGSAFELLLTEAMRGSGAGLTIVRAGTQSPGKTRAYFLPPVMAREGIFRTDAAGPGERPRCTRIADLPVTTARADAIGALTRAFGSGGEDAIGEVLEHIADNAVVETHER